MKQPSRDSYHISMNKHVAEDRQRENVSGRELVQTPIDQHMLGGRESRGLTEISTLEQRLISKCSRVTIHDEPGTLGRSKGVTICGTKRTSERAREANARSSWIMPLYCRSHDICDMEGAVLSDCLPCGLNRPASPAKRPSCSHQRPAGYSTREADGQNRRAEKGKGRRRVTCRRVPSIWFGNGTNDFQQRPRSASSWTPQRSMRRVLLLSPRQLHTTSTSQWTHDFTFGM